MGGETEWTIPTLKVLLEARIESAEKRTEEGITEAKEAVVLARKELERRLDGLNELRESVEKDRTQFVKTDVYVPAHEELRRQRVADAEKITVIQGDVKNNATEIAGIKSSQTWLTRLIIGAVILGLIAYVFQKLGR
jgi:hypothetical protein